MGYFAILWVEKKSENRDFFFFVFIMPIDLDETTHSWCMATALIFHWLTEKEGSSLLFSPAAGVVKCRGKSEHELKYHINYGIF